MIKPLLNLVHRNDCMLIGLTTITDYPRTRIASIIVAEFKCLEFCQLYCDIRNIKIVSEKVIKNLHNFLMSDTYISTLLCIGTNLEVYNFIESKYSKEASTDEFLHKLESRDNPLINEKG